MRLVMTIDALNLALSAVGVVMAILLPLTRMIGGIKKEINEIRLQAAEASGGQTARLVKLEAEQSALQNRLKRAEDKIFPTIT